MAARTESLELLAKVSRVLMIGVESWSLLAEVADSESKGRETTSLRVIMAKEEEPSLELRSTTCRMLQRVFGSGGNWIGCWSWRYLIVLLLDRYYRFSLSCRIHVVRRNWISLI